jgi:hypothetical protein
MPRDPPVALDLGTHIRIGDGSGHHQINRTADQPIEILF